MRRAFKVMAGLLTAASVSYLGYVARAYAGYGRHRPGVPGEAALDEFMPVYEVREVHTVRTKAAPEAAFAAVKEFSLQDSALIRLIFTLRALPARLAGAPKPLAPRLPLLVETRTLGWRTLDEVKGRRVVMGAVAEPWQKEVVFRGLSAEQFRRFGEPGHAKIAWTFEVQSRDAGGSLIRTETRVETTDAESRERFRRYWAFLSPGIVLIRVLGLRLVKARAERRAVTSGLDYSRLAP